MPNGNKPTVNEHYVPKCYLQNFAEVLTPKKIMLHCYDVSKESWLNDGELISADSVCFREHFYELRELNTNQFYARNMLEKTLQTYETKILSPLYKTIISRVQNNKNYCGNALLTTEEKQKLIFAIALQMARLPDTLEFVASKSCDELNIDEQSGENLSRLLCVPSSINNLGTDTSIVSVLMEQMKNMRITVGYYEIPVIMTSNNPVILFSESEIVYPISPNVVVIVRKDCPQEQRNNIIILNDDSIYRINVALKQQSNFLFSKECGSMSKFLGKSNTLSE